jgi:hypothetical protein
VASGSVGGAVRVAWPGGGYAAGGGGVPRSGLVMPLSSYASVGSSPLAPRAGLGGGGKPDRRVVASSGAAFGAGGKPGSRVVGASGSGRP